MNARRPLDGTLVVDATRMLPGAVLARTLVDLGARLVKVEDPAGGDPLRGTPPLVGGTGAAFLSFYRGAESVALDLRSPAGAAAFRRLARHADVVVESFRPGTLERWGLGLEDLSRTNPGLVTLSLSGFGAGNAWSQHPGHDLNFTAMSGFLSLLPPGASRVQPADVATAMQASTALLGALLVRARSGAGSRIEVPLAAATLPFVAWAAVDRSVGGPSLYDGMFSGRTPCYRLYRCADGRDVAVAAMEPKFWQALVSALGLDHLAGDGLDAGERGVAAALALEETFSGHTSSAWVDFARERGLPVTAVSSPEEALAGGFFQGAGLVEKTPLPGGGVLPTFVTSPGPWRAGEVGPAPELGEGTARVLASLGASSAEIAELGSVPPE